MVALLCSTRVGASTSSRMATMAAQAIGGTLPRRFASSSTIIAAMANAARAQGVEMRAPTSKKALQELVIFRVSPRLPQDSCGSFESSGGPAPTPSRQWPARGGTTAPPPRSPLSSAATPPDCSARWPCPGGPAPTPSRQWPARGGTAAPPPRSPLWSPATSPDCSARRPCPGGPAPRPSRQWPARGGTTAPPPRSCRHASDSLPNYSVRCCHLFSAAQTSHMLLRTPDTFPHRRVIFQDRKPHPRPHAALWPVPPGFSSATSEIVTTPRDTAFHRARQDHSRTDPPSSHPTRGSLCLAGVYCEEPEQEYK